VKLYIGKKGLMAVKLDISKAYDQVEWRFLEAVMGRMGFVSCWIHLMMTCMTIVNYVMVINGKLCRHIISEQGLRQGDPIFPYLFILCAESLSALLYKANRNGVLMGVTTSKRGPSDKPPLFYRGWLVILPIDISTMELPNRCFEIV
jgi:hypothetical protein